MEDMAKEYGTSEPQWVQWEEGAFCAAKYPEDKRWYRAKIINILHKTLIEVCNCVIMLCTEIFTLPTFLGVL